MFSQSLSELSEGVTITSGEQTMITKAQGEKVTLPCTFTFGPQDTGSLDIEWVLLQPDDEQTVSKSLDFSAVMYISFST